MRKQSNLLIYLLLALAPYPLVWFGLYRLDSIWASFAIYHGFCLSAWAMFREPLPPVAEVVWRRRYWLGLGAACLLVNIAVYFATGLMAQLIQPGNTTHALATRGNNTQNSMVYWLIAYFAIVNPICEELFWRQTVFAGFRSANIPAQTSAILSALLFGVWHWIPVRLFLPENVTMIVTTGITLLGYLLARFYDRNRKLTATIFVHALGADLPVLLLLLEQIKGK